MLTASTTFPEKAWAFHNRSLSINMSREVYISSFELMYESLSTTKLIDFQFRLLHNIITTNIQLKQWGLKDDDKCTFCNSQPETTIHLFLKCNFSGNIWNELYDYIARHSGTRISLADTEIMLGVRDKPFASFYNTITTITKQYIYACRCKQTNPTFLVLMEKISFEKHVEKIEAIRINKINNWQKKWELLSHLNFDI